MLNLRESFLTASFEDAKLDTNLKVTVVEDGGKPLLSSDNGILSSLPATKQAVLLQAYVPASLLTEGKTPYVYSSARLHNAAWHVITAIPYTSTVRTLAGMEYVFRLLLLLIVPVIFVATLIITRMVTRPLHKMAEGMRLSAGEHPARLPVGKNRDEIGKLTCAYNSMVDQLETLFTSIRTESERKRQAEFHALQAQINPHFLYNTIDTLRALAISGRTREVNDLLRSLGEFYRNSINNGRSIITVGEEINMVKSYMAIQSVRYNDIATEFDVDESVCASPIPKLTLQPLVENALYHGLRSSGHKGTIRVKAWQDTENVYLSVADDGVGIPEEAVESALKKDPPQEESRFGLRGTIDRLRLFYGESRQVTIESLPGCGTRITITIRKGGEAS
jgi:two-component system sensor histidine kinase YesM